MVQAYEKILYKELYEDSDPSVDHTSENNIIQREDVPFRREHMYRLIDNGLEKTRHEANIKDNIGSAMKVVNAMKKMIGDTVKDIPQAALPWAIVCVSLEVRQLAITATAVDPNCRQTKHSGRYYPILYCKPKPIAQLLNMLEIH